MVSASECTFEEYLKEVFGDDVQNMSNISNGTKGYAVREGYSLRFVPKCEFESLYSPEYGDELYRVELEDFELTPDTAEEGDCIYCIGRESEKPFIWSNPISTIEWVGIHQGVGAFYAMAYVTSDALRYEVTEKILSFIGDSKFIEMYCNAFGKQKLFDFKNTLLTAVFDETVRGEVNFNFKPNSGAYCVVDFLDDLMSGDNKVCMTHPDFNYNRIGAKAVAKVELTKEEKAKLKKAKTKLTVDKIQSEVDSRGVKMTYKDLYKGYKVSDLTWNEDRANLSALVQIPVILELPENQFGIKSIESFIFRNYTFIKDGILNITELPVILDDSTYSKFNKRGLIINDWFTKTEEGNHCLVSIESLPVVNKKRTKSVSSKVMTDLVVKLTQLKFDAKYLGYLRRNSM